MHYIFPTPLSYTEKDGTFTFTDKVYLTIPESFANKDFKKLAPELWNSFTAGKCTLEIIKSPSLRTTAYISATRQAIIQNCSTDFEYEADCTPHGIKLIFECECGLIHAFCTLLQLLPAYSLKNGNFTLGCFTVRDMPALSFRCMHLCVFPETSLLFLKKMVRLFGLMKCTHIILEFFGMLKFDCFPYLAWNNGYTKKSSHPLLPTAERSAWSLSRCSTISVIRAAQDSDWARTLCLIRLPNMRNILP